MPRQMFNIGVVQFFSWLAFFGMWAMATPALTEHVFKAPAPDASAFDMTIPAQAQAFTAANAAFQNAADLVGSYMGYYGLSSMAVALLLSFYASRVVINRRVVHFVSLILGGLGFLSMARGGQAGVPDRLLCTGRCGLGEHPVDALRPAGELGRPEEDGVYMGIFNMFIVIPQIVAATLLGWTLRVLFDNQSIYALIICGSSLIIGALCLVRVHEPKSAHVGPMAAAH